MLNSAIVLVVVFLLTVSWLWMYRQNQRLLHMLQETYRINRRQLEMMRMKDETIERLRRRPMIISSDIYHAYRINPASIHRN